MKKLIAGALSLTLTLLAPGFGSWAAAAHVVSRSLPVTRGTPTLRLNTPTLNAPALRLAPTLGAPVLSAVPAIAPTVAPAPAPVVSPLAVVQQAVGQLAEAPAPAQQSLTLTNVYDGGEHGKLGEGGDILPPPGTLSQNPSGLTPPDSASTQTRMKKDPPPPGSGPRRNKGWGAVKSVARVALAVGGVVGLQLAAAALLPGIFGLVPVAAVWAVSGGALLLPAALYTRYRLSKRDSPNLDKTKAVLDVFIGAFIGGLVIAAPSLGIVLASGSTAAVVAASAAAGGVGLAMARSDSMGFVDMLLGWTALTVVPAAVAVAAAGSIGLGPIIAMAALPAMTTISFFLGRIIQSAETGAPFSVPGSMQKLRFPNFPWVMTGVTFALLTGFGAVYSNLAFLAWTLFGNKTETRWDRNRSVFKNILAFATDFNVLYAGLLAWTAFTGFTSPLTFLVIAFAPERAAHWTERLLVKLHPKRAAAPSTKPEPKPDEQSFKHKEWPRYHHWLRTGLMLGSIAAFGALMGFSVYGFAALWKAAIPAVALSVIPLLISNWLVKKMMKAEPANENEDPEFFSIMAELREKINAKRRAAGKKEIPVPELVSIPMEIPNAFATGRSPWKATVGQTYGIKQLLLDPETARDGLVRLVTAADPAGKPFKAFRRAIARNVGGVTERSTPQEVAQAVLRADENELKALGYRMLRGVHAHEFSHVMDRHMVTGSIAGAMSSAIAFASYGVMWGVGHAQLAARSLWNRLTGKRKAAELPTERKADPNGQGVRPEALEPISTGIVLKSLPALLKMFAALWGPLIVQITQLAGTRNNEGQADEDGALLSEDPAALALALGMLTTWRPAAGFYLSPARLPLAAATAHMFTVNPLQQLDQAQALPKADAWGVEKGDNWLMDLFITHPDTRIRIERLWDMSEALPTGPPLAFKAEGRGPSSRGWFAVLSDKDRNREFWKYTLGQALILLGSNFHYTALPKLAGDGIYNNRAANWAAQGAASLTTGPLVDRYSTQRVLVWTQLGRTLLMLAVPILFFSGHLGFAVFAGLLALAGFLQSTGITAGSVAFNRILGDNQAEYNRANAVYNLVTNVVGVGAPLLAGGFIALLDAKFGLLSGNAVAYGVYAATLLGATFMYWRWLKIPRDDLLQARAALAKKLKGVVAGVSTRRDEAGESLVIEVRGQAPADLPAEFEGYPVKVVPARKVIKELVEGFVMIVKNRYLRLYLLFGTLSIMAGDALLFGAMPKLLESLGAGAGAFGVFLASASLGLGLSSIAMMFVKGKNLEKQGKWTSILHGLGWLGYWGVFFAGGVWTSAAALLLVMLLQGPGIVVWSSLNTKVVSEAYPADMGKVYSAMYFYMLVAAITGILIFGGVVASLPLATILWIIGGVATAAALLDIVLPWLIFPIKR